MRKFFHERETRTGRRGDKDRWVEFVAPEGGGAEGVRKRKEIVIATERDVVKKWTFGTINPSPLPCLKRRQAIVTCASHQGAPVQGGLRRMVTQF